MRSAAGDFGIVCWGGHVQGGANFAKQATKPTTQGPATIQITSLNPSSGVKSTSVTVAVIGIDLKPGDIIVWDGGSVATNYVYAGQVTTDPVTLGSTPRTVPV